MLVTRILKAFTIRRLNPKIRLFEARVTVEVSENILFLKVRELSVHFDFGQGNSIIILHKFFFKKMSGNPLCGALKSHASSITFFVFSMTKY